MKSWKWWALGWCALVPALAAAQGNELVFSITEGVTYQATPKEIRDKFAPIAEVLAKATGRRVRMQVVPAYDDVRAGMATQEFDVAFIHPAHVSMAEIKAGRYKAVAWTAGYTEYIASVLVAKDSPIKTLEDLKGQTMVTPDPDSITSAMVRAFLRVDKIPTTTGKQTVPGSIRIITTRYQDAVPFYIENGFAQAGVTAANAVVKAWTAKGGRVIYRSRPVPIKQFIVSTKLPADDAQKIRDALLGLRDTKALETVGYKGFVAPNPEIENSTIAWLGL